MGKTLWCQKLQIHETFLSGILLNQSMTFWVFFHWLKLKCSLIAKLILSSITSSSFFAGFINLTCGLLAKLFLWSFNVKKEFFSPLISMRFRILLFFKFFLLAILIFFLIELLAFLEFDVTALARSSWCSSLLNRYMLNVLPADVSVFFDCLTVLMLFFNFVTNWFLTLRKLITFSMSIRSFFNRTSPFTCFGHFNVFKPCLLLEL